MIYHVFPPHPLLAPHVACLWYPLTTQVCPGFAVADVDAEHARLRAAGADLVFAEPQPFPVGRFLAVRDPAGNVLELLQFNP